MLQQRNSDSRPGNKERIHVARLGNRFTLEPTKMPEKQTGAPRRFLNCVQQTATGKDNSPA